MRKEAIYRQIKISGMIFFIPLLLAAGPISGFFAGDYLQKRFGFPGYVVLLGMAVGFLASISETIRIIKLATRIDKKSV